MQDLIALLAAVSPVGWGILSAVSFGVADFLARFTSRRLGHRHSLLVTLCIGIVLFAPLFFLWSPVLVASAKGSLLIAIHGVLFASSMLLLYRVLARGPINVVAPIVAAHPAFILLFAFLLGSRPGLGQWLIIASILGCILLVTRVSGGIGTVQKGENTAPDFLRKTIHLSLLTSGLYAANVISAQNAVLIYGEVNTLWLGHLVAAVTLLLVMRGRVGGLSTTPRIWAVLIVQGMLNASGVLFLFAGSLGVYPEMTALLSSEFSVVTIVLAAVFLREKMSALQTAAVAGVFVATGYLAILE
jgi:uncharacterized membrane protein